MPEVLTSPEIQKMLPKIVGMVKTLCYEDDLGIYSPGYRDQLWQEAAQESGPFSEKIIELGQALKGAYITKEAYFKPKSLRFAGVEDQVTKELLNDLLLARIVTSPGHRVPLINETMEEQAMVTEVTDYYRGLRGGPTSWANLDIVIGSILAGNLKLTRQTQLEKK